MSDKRVWPRPRLVCRSEYTAGTARPQILLNGEWSFSADPPADFMCAGCDRSAWGKVPVPMSLPVIGISVPAGREYAYARQIEIPEEYAEKCVILRFYSVNCEARLFIDGHFIRKHFGGFNAWDADITKYVRPGGKHWIVLGVTDRQGLMSQFHSGGIQRDVELIALPKNHLVRMHAETGLENGYADGVLTVRYAMSLSDGAQVAFTLEDAEGNTVFERMEDASQAGERSFTQRVEGVHRWDSEHPYLYTLTARVASGGTVTEVFSRRIGFRTVERRGTRVYVNGDEIKLRGACREEVHPLKGRAIGREDILKDVLLLKEANCNFVRTSHYNPSQYFLELCDEYGIYVEEETSVSFIGQGQAYSSDDPMYTACFMDQFAEMIEMDRSHPCVIIWSLANESVWGGNFEKELLYAKREDPSRLTIFSYPITMPEDCENVDIWSAHYNNWDMDKAAMTHNGNVGGARGAHRLPVLHDEYIHVPCYNTDELGKDPGIRDFWGESAKRFWDDIYDTPGALGGAVWCFLDEVWLGPDGPLSAYEWGIVDGYRRKKPEFYHLRKAYSPIRLDGDTVRVTDGGCTVGIRNRYCHTALDEITAVWTDRKGNSGEFACPPLRPGERGELTVPNEAFEHSGSARVSFREPGGGVCDEYVLRLHEKRRAAPVLGESAPEVHDEEDTLFVSCGDILYIFSKETGRFSSYDGDEELIKDGPFLNLGSFRPGEWECGSFEWEAKGRCRITVRGRCGKIELTFVFEIDGSGRMQIEYRADEVPYAPHKTVMRNYDGSTARHCGGYSEIGLAFRVGAKNDELEWERRGLWGEYPSDHIGRLSGRCRKARDGGEEAYREEPRWEWKDDMRDYPLFGTCDIGGRGTQDFRSAKDGIVSASLYSGETGCGVTVRSDGTQSVRCEVLPDPDLMIANTDARVTRLGCWETVKTARGTWDGTYARGRKKGDRLRVDFSGTGIAWYACRDACFGTANVYLDGEMRVKGLQLGTQGSVLRGEEFRAHCLAYSALGLPEGRHVLEIEAAGERARGQRHRNISPNTYVGVDSFELPGRLLSGDVMLYVNSGLNYTGIGWGNYTRPMLRFDAGYSSRVFLEPKRGLPNG